MNKSAGDVSKHHYVRTIVSSIFGVIALWLIILSILVVWLNRTITDTNTYVSTVTPLASQPAVKDFIRQKIDEQITKSVSDSDLAQQLLTSSQIQGKTNGKLHNLVITQVNKQVETVLNSSRFVTLWRDTNRTAHRQLVSQLNSGSPEITLDFTKTLTGTLELLGSTRLAPVVGNLQIDSGQAVIKLKSSEITSIHKAYKQFQQATILVILAAITASSLAVIISVHHMRTLRRIGLMVGISLVIIFAVLSYAPYIKFGGTDPASAELIKTVMSTLLRTLRLTTIITAIVLLIGVAGSKAANIVKARGAKREVSEEK